MILGYNTNGFAHHRLSDALEILAELGYGGVALTPDVNHLPPFPEDDIVDDDRPYRINVVSDDLDRLKLACVIETGARFLLDPLHKHQPTLISPDADGRYERLAFLQDCLDIAKNLGSDVVSFWSGTSTDDSTHRMLMTRLVDGCKRFSDAAAQKNIRLAFEPEPGMFIDTMDKFAELHDKVNHPNFGLTLDVGHLVCLNELPISKHIHNWKHKLWNVHLDDMKPGVHDHLMFGEGEVDFNDVFTALKAIDYKGMASVELSRHSYDAVNVARKSMEFLKRYA
jgi:L-ribulose-5-phosphate 3-epimerase